MNDPSARQGVSLADGSGSRQRRTVPSPLKEGVAAVRGKGDAPHIAPVPLDALALLARLDIPQPQRVVVRAQQGAAPIGGKGHAQDSTLMIR
jgi:hypothetical protein